MSKKPFKSQASSSRVFSQSSTGFGATTDSTSRGFGSAPSALSYLAEQPDLASLTDSNVIVQFKNLAKKDSTTKAKALEELQSYLTSLKDSQVEADESFLNAWVKVYPRLSIDGSRRVRQLAHLLHGAVCLNSGKRVARYMPNVIGAWFAGSHDNDRVVVRAAQEAFDVVFPTPEKRTALPKAYQASILEFCNSAILNESVQSLSDERTTKAEDAEAKFFRVASSSILTICDLISQLSDTEIRKQSVLYNQVLGAEKLWDFQASKDQIVRRSVFKLLRSCTSNQKGLLSDHINLIVASMLSKQTIRRQRGTAIDYCASFGVLSSSYPCIWTNPSVRENVMNRLSDLVKHGSQGASEAYWKELGQLFANIPEDLLPDKLDPAVELLNALKTGFMRKDEPRSNIEWAWGCYILVAERIGPLLGTEDYQQLICISVLPILQNYINPNAEQFEWTISGPKPLNIVAKILRSGLSQGIVVHVVAIAGKLREDIKIIAPEQSKDFEPSQISISARSAKWFELQAYMKRDRQFEDVSWNFWQESIGIVITLIETLKARNGKPYGVAKAVEAAVTSLKQWLFQDENVSRLLDRFILSDIPDLIYSPSHYQLVCTLYESYQSAKFSEAWERTLQAILDSTKAELKVSLLEEFLAFPNVPAMFEMPLKSLELQKLLRYEVDRTIDGSLDWRFLAHLTAAPASNLSSETTDYMLSKIAESLTIEEKVPRSLTGLEMLAREGQERLVHTLQNQADYSLRQNILLLTESQDEILAQRATEVNQKIEKALANGLGAEPSTRSTRSVIAKGLYEADENSLSVDTIVNLAQRHIENSQGEKGEMVKQILPAFSKWTDALEPMLLKPVPQSLAFSTQLGGAAFLVNDALDETSRGPDIHYDRDGFSVALRMALYVINLIEDASLFDSLIDEDQAEVFRLLLLTVQLIDDNVAIIGSNSLWSSYDLSTEEEMLSYISRAGVLFKRWLEKSGPESATVENDPPGFFVEMARSELLKKIEGQSTEAMRCARAYCYIVSELIEMHGWRSSSDSLIQTRFEQLRKSGDILKLINLICGYRTPLSTTKGYVRTCNELIANITGMKLDVVPMECLKQLTLLDLMLEGQEQLIESVAKQRIVFFVKQAVSWLQDEQATDALKAEVCKLLVTFLPTIKDVYGTHWSDILDYFINSWGRAGPADETNGSQARLPLEHASLRLMVMLKNLSFDGESNEDLKEAWQESSGPLLNGMITLLEVLNTKTDASNQPLRIVNELLARQILSMPTEQTRDPSNLYSLIAVESTPVQRTAFEILHKRIPKMQEQISVDTALEKSVAQLPDELMSLIIDSPLPESLSEANFTNGMAPSVRCYLASWLLVFDHFKGASDKVRSDYTSRIKEGNYLSTLLDFMFDILGHSRGRPVDAAKFDITVYSFDIEESPIQDLQWLLAHLYFVCLKRTPAIAKSWWIDCKSRQTEKSVEAWTEKFISPHLINDALSTVDEWAATQDTSSNESVIVKTNPRTKEVTVSKEVDDQVMSMAIRLPANFPLGPAVPYGINRVAVDEKKWRSWLLNSQGVITFSNNSLIDGIIAFRRNVVGALKGQTECAICYSIVGADKQLPTKKCGTCNNLFHGSCLYRWFKSSNSSSCPLCRNPFNYT